MLCHLGNALRSVGLAVALGLFIAAGAWGDGLQHLEVSVAQVDEAAGLPWKVAQQQGFLAKHGLAIDRIIPAIGGNATLQNVVAGHLPFGVVATSALIAAHMKGAPVRAIACSTQAPWEIGWGVAKGSPARSIRNLAGGVWGFTNAGSVSEAMSYLVPKRAGLNMNRVRRMSTGGVDAGLAMMDAGAVDITFVPPAVEAAQAERFEWVIRSDQYVPRYAMTMIVSSRNYAEENPEVARRLLRALQEAIDWIENQPADAARIYAKSARIAPDQALRIVKKYIAAKAWNLGFEPSALLPVAEGLRYTDGIQSVNWRAVLTDAYLPDDIKGGIPE